LVTPTTDLAKEFFAKLDSLELTRSKMEKLRTKNEIELSDVERVYSGLFLEAFIAFEGLLEDLFFGLLEGNLQHNSNDVKPVTIEPKSAIRGILFEGEKKRYLEWMPYNITEDRANLFFEEGKPFTQLDNGLKSNLQQLHRIRNAIAHQSEDAIKQFNEKVIGSNILAPEEQTPLGYLIGKYNVNRTGNLTRYGHYMKQLRTIVTNLAS